MTTMLPAWQAAANAAAQASAAGESAKEVTAKAKAAAKDAAAQAQATTADTADKAQQKSEGVWQKVRRCPAPELCKMRMGYYDVGSAHGVVMARRMLRLTWLISPVCRMRSKVGILAATKLLMRVDTDAAV